MLLPSAVGPVPGKCGSNASASLRRYVSGSECQGRSLSCAAYGGGRSAVQQTQNIRRQLEPDAQDLYLQELLAAADPHADELDIPQFTLDVCDSSMHQTASATPAFQPGQQSFMQHAVQHQQVPAPARTQHRTHRQNFGQQPGHSHDSTEQRYEHEQRDSSASPHRGQRRSYHVLNNATSTQRYPARHNSNQQQQQPEQQQPNHYQGHGSQPLHPRALTHLLSKCRSLSELQQQCKQHLDDFNHLHVACAMNRLAKCPEATQPQYSMVSKGLMQTLEVLFVHHLPQYSAREVANALWCWAKVSHEPRSSTKQMVAATITAEGGALLRHHACTTQALANLAWGLAVLKWTDTGVWSCLTDSVHAALRRHQQTQPEHGQGGSEWQGGGWAGSGRGHHQSSSPQQRGASGRGSASWHQRGPQTGRDPLRFAPVDLASLAFSYATARCGGLDMFRTLVEVAQSELQEFCALDLSNLLWACATMRYTPQPLFHAAMPMVVACITGFTPQGLANTAWAYAIAGVNSPVVFGALCLQAQQQATQMEPPHHSQLVWAMVRAKQVHPPVVHAAIASVMDTPDAWHTHNLARLLYSLTAGDMSQSVEFASLTPLLKQRLRSLCEASTQPATAEPAADQGCEPDTQLLAARPEPGRRGKARVCFQDVSQVLWAHAMAHAYDAELFELAQQLCLADTAAWTANPACFQSMIWSFGYAGHYHPALFQVAAQQLAALTPDSASHMSLSHIAGVLVSLAQIQHHDSAACTAAADHVLAVCRERPETVTNATLMNVLWALMLLGHLHEPLLRAALDLVARRWQVQSMYMQQAVPFGSRGRARKAVLDEDDQGWSDADTLAAVEAGYSEGAGAVEAAVRGRGRRQALGRVTTPDVDTAAVPKGGLRLNGEHLYNKQMAQLLQIILWLQDEHGSAGTALVQELVPESLHSLAGATWREYTRKECMVSAFQNELCKAFQALGVPCKLEQLTADSLFSMDTVVRIGGRDVSVEANGPLHYTRTSPRTMLGNKVLRDRFVRARGYTVLNVPYWDWEEVENDGSAVAQYLYTRLVQELGPEAEAELKGLMADR